MGQVSLTMYGSLPPSVERALRELLLPEVSGSLSSQSLRSLRARARARTKIDYTSDWAAFTYLYFAANLAKSYLAVRSIDPADLPSEIHLADLGCGGGASTLGALIALRESVPERIRSLRAVDSSSEQLAVFRHCVQPWIEAHLPQVGIAISKADVLDARTYDDATDNVFLLSYVRSELSPDEWEALCALLALKSLRRPLAICIESASPHRGIVVDRLNGQRYVLGYDNVVLDLGRLAMLSPGCPPKFSSETVSAGRVLDDYFEAWRTQSTQAISRLFSANASYEIAGVGTLRGIGEITRYWEKNAREQRDVRCESTTTVLTADGIAASWQATFRRIDRGETRELDGVLFLVVVDGLIVRLAEAYSQKAVRDIDQLRGADRHRS